MDKSGNKKDNKKKKEVIFSNDQLGENASEEYKSGSYDNLGKNSGKQK